MSEASPISPEDADASASSSSQLTQSQTQLPGTQRKPLFSDLARLFELMSGMQGKIRKEAILHRYFTGWRRYFGDIYPAMRLILSHIDRGRKMYKLEETKLAKLYVHVLGLGKDSEDAKNLIHWRLPGTKKLKLAGDFAEIAFGIIAKRSTLTGRSFMTIYEVNEQLDRLSNAVDKDTQASVLRRFFLECSATEQKWIIRIILKDLKIGISERTVFKAFHPDAYDLFNTCSDLKKVCEDLFDPQVRLHTGPVSIFLPFKPMLASRVDAIDQIPEAMNKEPFWLEQKLDGERIQLHVKGAEFQYWSRNAKDYTYIYGANKDEGSLTPFIYDQFHQNIDSVILDGEMVAYDPIIDIFLEFGTLKSVGLDMSVDPDKPRPCFVIFDALYCNGTPLLDQPLDKRYEIARRIVEDKKGYIMILPHNLGSTKKDIDDALEQTILEGNEGLMIKNPKSKYVLNERTKSWIKLKPDYLHEFVDNLDVVIVGGYYGAGRRGDKLSHFLCAVRDSDSDSEKWLTLCRFGSGYSNEQLDEFNQRLTSWKRFNPTNPPTWLGFGSGSRDKPDVYIHPNESIVVELKVGSILLNPMMGSGYSLRFPRFVRFRDDKNTKDGLTLRELIKLHQEDLGRTNSFLKHTQEQVKSKRSGTRKATKYTVPKEFLAANTSEVEVESDIFNNMAFLILKGNEAYSKQELETLIKKHGGQFYQNPKVKRDLLAIVDDPKYIRAQAIIQKNTHDIVKTQWLLDCITARELIPLKPKYMLHVTDKRQSEFRKQLDPWGDSYTEDLTVESLREIFGGMTLDKSTSLTGIGPLNSLIDAIAEDAFDDILPGNLFRPLIIYLDVPRNPHAFTRQSESLANDNCVKRISIIIRWNGGQVVCDGGRIEEDITHVVVDENDMTRLDRIRESFRGRKRVPRVVTTQWVEACCQQQRLLDEKAFEPRMPKPLL
ncbi:uncharacterized protein VTP21DRAFT_1736 [Calcarisporiella thermophila]|uniref:uncharacterized protein n=1 Tax=Calcarisporiella thermophila TaxID=911321 RepID=UPI0037428480